MDAPFRFPYRELSLFVLEPDGSPVFQSTGGVLQLEEQILDEARLAPVWWAYSRGGQNHQAYLFHDGTHTFVLSYVKTSVLTYAAELAAWAVLAAGLTLFALVVALVLGAAGSERGVSPWELLAGTSFHGKLYVAFVLIALVPIASLAFLIRGIVIQQLERDIEQEGVARAQVVERFVNDSLRSRRVGTDAPGDTTVTDAVLEWVGSLAGVDVDLYASGELVATSKPELFGSGLLRSIVPRPRRTATSSSRGVPTPSIESRWARSSISLSRSRSRSSGVKSREFSRYRWRARKPKSISASRR